MMDGYYEVKGATVWVHLNKAVWDLDELKELVRQIQEDLE